MLQRHISGVPCGNFYLPTQPPQSPLAAAYQHPLFPVLHLISSYCFFVSLYQSPGPISPVSISVWSPALSWLLFSKLCSKDAILICTTELAASNPVSYCAW